MSRLVTILAIDDLSIAYLAKGQLEAAGIPCFLANEYTVGVNWMYANALGGIQLQVPAEAAEEALAVFEGEETFAKSDGYEGYFDGLKNVSLQSEHGHEISGHVHTQSSYAENEKEMKKGEICPRYGSGDIEEHSLRRPLGALSFLLGFPLPFAPRWNKCLNCKQRWR